MLFTKHSSGTILLDGTTPDFFVIMLLSVLFLTLFTFDASRCKVFCMFMLQNNPSRYFNIDCLFIQFLFILTVVQCFLMGIRLFLYCHLLIWSLIHLALSTTLPVTTDIKVFIELSSKTRWIDLIWHIRVQLGFLLSIYAFSIDVTYCDDPVLWDAVIKILKTADSVRSKTAFAHTLCIETFYGKSTAKNHRLVNKDAE